MNIGNGYFFLSLRPFFLFSLPFFHVRKKSAPRWIKRRRRETRSAQPRQVVLIFSYVLRVAPVERCFLSMVSITAKRACQDKDTSWLPARRASTNPLSPLLYYRVFWRCPEYPLDFRSSPPSPLYFFVFLKLSSEKLDLCRISTKRTSGGYEELRLSDQLAQPRSCDTSIGRVFCSILMSTKDEY